MDYSLLLGNASPGTEEARQALLKAADCVDEKKPMDIVTDPRFEHYFRLPWTAYLTEMKKIQNELVECDKLSSREMGSVPLFGVSGIYDSLPPASITSQQARDAIVQLIRTNKDLPGGGAIDRGMILKAMIQLKNMDNEDMIKHGQLAILQQRIFLRVSIISSKFRLLERMIDFRFGVESILNLSKKDNQTTEKIETFKNEFSDLMASIFMKVSTFTYIIIRQIGDIDEDDNSDGYFESEENESDGSDDSDNHDQPGNDPGEKVFEEIINSFYAKSKEEKEIALLKNWSKDKSIDGLVAKRDDKAGLYEIRLPFFFAKTDISVYTNKINQSFGKKIVVEAGTREEDGGLWIVLNNKHAAETSAKWCFDVKEKMTSIPISISKDTEFEALLVNVPKETLENEVKDIITHTEGQDIKLKCDPKVLKSESNDEDSTKRILLTFYSERDYKIARRGLGSLEMLGIKMKPYHT